MLKSQRGVNGKQGRRQKKPIASVVSTSLTVTSTRLDANSPPDVLLRQDSTRRGLPRVADMMSEAQVDANERKGESSVRKSLSRHFYSAIKGSRSEEEGYGEGKSPQLEGTIATIV